MNRDQRKEKTDFRLAYASTVESNIYAFPFNLSLILTRINQNVSPTTKTKVRQIDQQIAYTEMLGLER